MAQPPIYVRFFASHDMLGCCNAKSQWKAYTIERGPKSSSKIYYWPRDVFTRIHVSNDARTITVLLGMFRPWTRMDKLAIEWIFYHAPEDVIVRDGQLEKKAVVGKGKTTYSYGKATPWTPREVELLDKAFITGAPGATIKRMTVPIPVLGGFFAKTLH
ncbi:hypothetical protein P7C73_g146, partial [Tremellales sp. Uapishka_1]